MLVVFPFDDLNSFKTKSELNSKEEICLRVRVYVVISFKQCRSYFFLKS